MVIATTLSPQQIKTPRGEWELTAVGSLARFSSGQGISVSGLHARSSDHPIPVYGGNGIAGFTDTPMITHPTLVVGRVGQRCGEVHVTTGPAWITDNALYPVRLLRPLDIHFFALALSAANLNDVRNRNDLPLVTQSILHDARIVWPYDIKEQRAIATTLHDVDALLSEIDQLIVKKRNLKQAAMQQLLTTKTRLPGFHGEWKPKRLGEICEIEMGRTPPRHNQAYWGHGYKWLAIADLKSKVVADSKEEITELASSTMTIIPKGTLLMSFKLSIGRLCFAGCDLFTNEAICSFNKLQANADFLYYALGTTDFSLYGKQAVKGYTLNKESLKLIEMRLPELPEQTAIAAVLSDIDGELSALEARRNKTRALKQAMMQELLTGRTRLL
jgi:type I restriction enzyme S subunit